MPAFDDVSMPINIARGAKGGPQFATTVIVSAGGREQRIGQWNQPRRRWDVSHALRTNAQRDELIAFFIARQGRLRSFRFLDPSDSEVTPPALTVELTATTFQLVKRYASGAVEQVRTITKPVAGTIHLWNGGTEITSGFTVDSTTGVATFASAPGYVPAAGFTFECEVRFDTDVMEFTQEEITYGTWATVPLIEIRS